MKEFNIVPMDLEYDLNQICDWERQFENSPKFDSIRKFVLEDNLFYGLGEVIFTNYELIPIGSFERKYALSIKNNNNKVIGFILALVDDLNTNHPELMLQYIVMHPEYQNKGLGPKVLTELLDNHEEYFNSPVSSVFVRIHAENKPSIKTFKKLGFNFNKVNEEYFAAELKILENNKE